MANKKGDKVIQDFSKYVRWFWILFLLGVLSVILLFFLASKGKLGKMPDHTQLANPKVNLAAEIISSDGKNIGKFYLENNRTAVTYNELSKHLVDALIATEDTRFFDHAGIDARGTLRAFFYLGSRGGASTISQQLARQLFIGIRSKNKLETASQKIKEWVIAVRLEEHYTKEEIIAQYFDIYGFGNNTFGIKSAAKVYFNKEPKDLDIKESAMLVGMFKSSSIFNPIKHPETVKIRRNVVLAQMHKYEYIDEKLKDSIQKTDLGLNFSPESHNHGIATYFREYLRAYMKDWIKNNPKPDGTLYDLYNDGLKIYTTIDSRMQQYAEDAVTMHMSSLQEKFFNQNTTKRNPTAPFLGLSTKEVDDLLNRHMSRGERWRILKAAGKSNEAIRASFQKPTKMRVFSWKDGKASEVDTIMKPIDSMRYYKSFFHTGMLSMNPQTGHVKVWVGDIDHKHFQYDMVKEGKRQVGSTFKPFVYAAAIDQLHLSPCYELPNTPHCIEANAHGVHDKWCPKNANNNYGGSLNLVDALAKSVNTTTARLMDKVGPKAVINLTKEMGIESDIPELPSIALGTPDISVYEMVGAYATFANQGYYTKPTIVASITDKTGKILYSENRTIRQVLSDEVAYVTVKLMEGVTKSGSGARLRGKPYNFINDIAGKTGTTQNQSDGWFMGMVPNLVTGVWVGAEDRAVHFKSVRDGQGAAMALPIWGLYMKSCYADETLNISKANFERPVELSIDVDCSIIKPEKFFEYDDKDPDDFFNE